MFSLSAGCCLTYQERRKMADKIIVDFDALDRISSRLNAAGRELDQAMSQLARLHVTRDAGADVRISGCRAKLRVTGMTVSPGTIGDAVSSYKSAVGNVSWYTNNLSAAVQSVFEMFERTENSLSGKELDTGESVPTSKGAENEASGSSAWDVFLKYLQKALGKAGILGTIGSAIWAGSSGLSNKAPFEVLANYLAKTVPAYAKWAKSDDYMPQLLGLQKFLKTPATEGPKWARMASDFGSGLKKGLTSGPAWIAAGVSSAFNNYHEYANGDISGDRAVFETITETAGTVGTSALIAAGVAAVIPAAPAVAVGVIAAGIFFVGDMAVEHFTGKGIVENIGTWTGDLYDGLKEKCKSTGASIVNGWNAFSRSVSSVFSQQPMLSGGGGSW